MNCKVALRRDMILKRKAEGRKENGELITEKIIQLAEYKNAETVMLYMPIKNEVDVTRLLEYAKTFVVPVTKADDIYACRAEGEWLEGKFGVPEPENKEVFDKKKIDLVIVPGVAFDKRLNRMGYGKGYYDRFLKDMHCVKIGVCHSFQLMEEIECEEHDVKMDMVITEDEIWRRESIL